MRGPSERVYIVAAIVLVAVIIAAALILPGVIHPKGSSNSGSNSNVTVLEPIGWAVVTIGVDQWADITFQNAGTANLSGAFESTNTITAYVMNNAQFGSLIKNLSVDGYEWTSGLVWKGTINYTVSVGSWNLVFFNTNPYGSSGIAATSPIELTKV